ncbi:hypothetical protein NY2A_b360L [Paramecium bursaria Chlorella virus NY2A]|uniref:Uncharacterized protein b360L n=1 Tax=Paramecium bursaria Chlorella virus NY2A TaxID=46021 RepID=A7IWN5_PBCVN|nr:hypothetical protein NY2A_b360L [Paramecium bursaria Chlorella virus NY2A]ABT14759.1 hypothetical protein NY2A_b360L [Paramecium bursaria Chlorella virus NY2A]
MTIFLSFASIEYSKKSCCFIPDFFGSRSIAMVCFGRYSKNAPLPADGSITTDSSSFTIFSSMFTHVSATSLLV